MRERHFRSISLRLLSGVLLISSLLTLGTTSFLVYREYDRDVSDFDAIFEQIETSYLTPIATATWELNIDQVKISLNGIHDLPDIEYVKIVDGEQVIAETGKVTPQIDRIETFDLVFDYQGEIKKVGTLEVHATMTRIYERLKRRIVAIILSQAAKTFLASFLILIFANYLLTSRIVRIANFFREYSPDRRSTHHLAVQHRLGKEDDLDWLATAINSMIGRLNDLYDTLEDKIARRTKEIADKNRELRVLLDNNSSGIFSIGSNLLIEDGYSLAMERIFETSGIKGKDAIDFMFANADFGSEELGSIRSSVISMLDSYIAAFNANYSKLPREMTVAFNGGRKKRLEIDWAPETVNEHVLRLLVTIRDVTDLKQAREEARTKDRDLRLVTNMIEVGHDSFTRFMDSSRRYIASAIEITNDGFLENEEDLSTNRRHLHTIKGDARTLGFIELSQTVHESEDFLERTLIESVPSKKKAKFDLFNQSLRIVHETLDHYSSIYREKFAMGTNHRAPIDRIFDGIDEIDLNDLDTSKEFAHILIQRYARATSKTLKEISEPLVHRIAAHQKSGEDAELNIVIEENAGIRVRESIAGALSSAISHCLQNVLDHGIESRAERESSGKFSRGTLAMRLVQGETGSVLLEIEDDGRGLNMAKLRRTAKNRGIRLADQESNRAELAFEAGISTKDEVSETSGRGIGLSAARSLAREAGCELQLEFTGPESMDGFRSFKVVITIPRSKTMVEIGAETGPGIRASG